jgi:hypothetical protein
VRREGGAPEVGSVGVGFSRVGREWWSRERNVDGASVERRGKYFHKNRMGHGGKGGN